MRGSRRSESATISLLPVAREVSLAPGQSVFDCAAEAGVELNAPCLGGGYCGCCRIRFIEGAPEPDVWERLHLSEDELGAGVRLACRSHPGTAAIVTVPSRPPDVTIDGRRYGVALEPWARTATVTASAAHLCADTRHVLPEAALNVSPRPITLHTSGPLVHAVELGTAAARSLAVSAVVDATTITGWMLDLRDGQPLAEATAALIGGSGDATVVGRALQRLIGTLCAQQRMRAYQLADVLVVGAADIEDTGGRLPLRRLADGRDAMAELASCAVLGARAAPDVPTLLVGLAPRPWALALEGEAGYLVLSELPSAAGQPFAPVGSAGSVSRVAWMNGTELQYDGPEPRAFTLSAAADIIVRLHELGRLDARGRVTRESQCRSTGGAPGAASDGARPEEPDLADLGLGAGLVLSQQQVRAFQRIKATVRQLIALALDAAGQTPDDLAELVLVGRELGSFSIHTAAASGLVPASDRARVRLEPEAVETGARLCILSYRATLDARRIAGSIVTATAPRRPDQWPVYLYLGQDSELPRRIYPAAEPEAPRPLPASATG